MRPLSSSAINQSRCPSNQQAGHVTHRLTIASKNRPQGIPHQLSNTYNNMRTYEKICRFLNRKQEVCYSNPRLVMLFASLMHLVFVAGSGGCWRPNHSVSSWLIVTEGHVTHRPAIASKNSSQGVPQHLSKL